MTADDKRGVIRNRQFAQQLRDFTGLRFGKITPTDIDGFLDFGNKCFVFIKAKHGVSSPPLGQLIALERLCDACQDAGKHTLLILASHETNGDVDVGNARVVKHRYMRKWKTPNSPTTVRQHIDSFLSWFNHKAQ